MSTAPKKPCANPGCGHMAENGRYCKEHAATIAKYQQPEERLSSRERGYSTPRWRAYRKWYLANHPVCVVCGAPANEVDHIIPAKGADDKEFYNSDNHQALCKACHSRKTATENGGFGNHEKN